MTYTGVRALPRPDRRTISWDLEANMARAEKLVREAAAQGAQIILLQVRIMPASARTVKPEEP
jgi:hypothetical protein